MSDLLKVLIGTLARFLRAAAERLARWAAGSAAAPERPVPAWGASPAGAPEHWIRRAVPPPPEHWLAVVRARAPHFVPQDPRRPAVRPCVPALPPVVRPIAPIDPAREALPARSEARVESAREPRRRTGAPEPRPVPRRVITVVEEQAARRSRAAEPVLEVPTAAPEQAAEPTLPSLHRPPGLPWPRLEPERRSVPRSVDVEPAPELAPLRLVRAEEPALRSRPCVDDPRPRVEGGRRAAATVSPDLFCSDPESPAPLSESFGSPSWPALPTSPVDDPRDLCRELLREALFRNELEREQRGSPWSA